MAGSGMNGVRFHITKKESAQMIEPIDCKLLYVLPALGLHIKNGFCSNFFFRFIFL